MMFQTILASVLGVCPAPDVQGTWPRAVYEGCPSPASGVLYQHGHEDLDRQAIDQLRRSADTIDRLTEIVKEHDAETHPAVWVSIGLGLGAALMYAAQEL